MSLSAIQLLSNASQNAKLAASIGTATATTGLAASLDWIPSDIGKLASVIGLALSIVLIVIHTKKYRRNEKRNEEKHSLEMKILNKELKK